MKHLTLSLLVQGQQVLRRRYAFAEQRVKVLLIERGTAPGAKNMMGGRIYTHSLERLVPDFRDRAPLERKVTKRRISIGAGK